MLQYSCLNDAWGHNTGTKSKHEQFSQPIEPKPIELKPIELKPIELKPIELKPIELKPIELKPIEPKPIELKPIEPKPIKLKPIETFSCSQCQHIRTFEFFGIKVNITKDVLTFILIMLIIAIFIQLLYLMNDCSNIKQDKYYMITSSELNNIITSILLDKSLGINKLNYIDKI